MREDMTEQEELDWLRKEVKRLGDEVDNWKDLNGFSYDDGYQSGSEAWGSFVLMMQEIMRATGREVRLSFLPERGFMLSCPFFENGPHDNLEQVMTRATDDRWGSPQVRATLAALAARRNGEDPNC